MIHNRIIRMKALRQEQQNLSRIAADMLGISPSEVIELAHKRLEIKHMLDQLQQGDNQYIKTLLQIYDALGYTDDLPQLQQGEILHAIDAVHKSALGNGYKWNGQQYENGSKVVGIDYVAQRVKAEAA